MEKVPFIRGENELIWARLVHNEELDLLWICPRWWPPMVHRAVWFAHTEGGVNMIQTVLDLPHRFYSPFDLRRVQVWLRFDRMSAIALFFPLIPGFEKVKEHCNGCVFLSRVEHPIGLLGASRRQ